MSLRYFTCFIFSLSSTKTKTCRTMCHNRNLIWLAVMSLCSVFFHINWIFIWKSFFFWVSFFLTYWSSSNQCKLTRLLRNPNSKTFLEKMDVWIHDIFFQFNHYWKKIKKEIFRRSFNGTSLKNIYQFKTLEFLQLSFSIFLSDSILLKKISNFMKYA